MSNERYHELVVIGKLITDYVGEGDAVRQGTGSSWMRTLGWQWR